VFVKVRHEIRNQQGLALIEDHDIVYRESDAKRAPKGPHVSGPNTRDGRPGSFGPGVLEPVWTREIIPDEVLLFRYSALTFNGYRIHYDRRFATDVQGYSGLVVHAPLMATLLADLLRRHLPAADVAALTFRALRPLFDGDPLLACGSPDSDGKTVRLWGQDASGAVAFEATAMLSGKPVQPAGSSQLAAGESL